MASEFDIIKQYFSFSLAGKAAGVQLGIGDDAAVLNLASKQLVVATDTLVSGVHFPEDMAAEHIASRTLGVNLSDFAAMGVQPRWLTLALTLPEHDQGWLKKFSANLALHCEHYGVALVGGDTTRGSLSITLTVLGEREVDASSEPKPYLLRNTACVGDDIWVSGALGKGAAALAVIQAKENTLPTGLALSEQDKQQLLDSFYVPLPRLKLGCALRGIAHAAIDISDGLLADAGHIAKLSRVGMVIDGDKLPLHTALAAQQKNALVRQWVLSGGDEYELLFTAPVSQRDNIMQIASQTTACTLVGKVESGSGVRLAGEGWSLPEQQGYTHF